MLQLQVVIHEKWDEDKNEFVQTTWPLKLEHSLVSLSKWESKFEKPFFGNTEKAKEEVIAYVMMMDLGDKTPLEVFLSLAAEDYTAISQYIHSKKTATWFNKRTDNKPSTQVITSELIYYWMTSYEIPWEAQHWHLNRLFTLIEVFTEERNAADSKSGGKTVNRSSANSLAARRKALNEQRKKAMGTSG